MSNPFTESAQDDFLRLGGVLRLPMMAKYKTGEMKLYEFQEYPKSVLISCGVQEIPCSTETIKGETKHWTETREVFADCVVYSAEEERKVFRAADRAESLGIKIEPHWTTAVLLASVTEKLAADSRKAAIQPVSEADFRKARKIAALKAELAALELPDGAALLDADEAESPETAAIAATTADEAPAMPRRPHRRTKPLPSEAGGSDIAA